MRSRAAAIAIALLTLTGGALAQTAQPAIPHRQPRPATAPTPQATPDTAATSLEATRKRFEANAAKQSEADRKRDSKLDHSMRSICAGCDAPSAKRARP